MSLEFSKVLSDYLRFSLVLYVDLPGPLSVSEVLRGSEWFKKVL